MMFLFIYLGIGIAAFFALRTLFRKTGVDRRGLYIVWGSSLMADWGIFIVPLFWPIFALLSLVWWLLEIWHLKSKQKVAREKAEELKHANEYSHLTMDELLAEQKKKMDELQTRK